MLFRTGALCATTALLLMTQVTEAYAKSDKNSQPNIIYIMTDDHAYQAIGAYGSTINETPNIDRLAEEGMRFDRAYVTNSICSPSRAVTLTGKFSHLNSVKDNLDVFDGSQQTYPKLLQQHGYETAIYGKWHLKSTPTGFDHWEVLPDQGHYYHPEFRTPEGEVKETGYVTNIITKKAINYLDSLRDKSKPFMLMYHHKAPHRQWWPDMQDIESATQKTYPEPDSLFDDFEHQGTAAKGAEMRIGDHMGLTLDNKIKPELANAMGYEEFLDWYESSYDERYNRLTDKEKAYWDSVYGPINDEFASKKLKGKELIRWKYQRYMQDYLATVDSVDRNIGYLLDYLDKSGLADNTIVVYTSDQGFYLGEHGWFDKRFMYEESYRTPLIVRWPGKVEQGISTDKLVQNIDYAPTMLQWAGVEVPADMQGKSLIPLLTEQEGNWRDALYYHYYEHDGIHMVKRHYGVRTDRYKLIHFYHDVDEWELYDLETDPSERNNLIKDPAYKQVFAKLKLRLEQLRHQYQDSDELAQSMIKSDLKRLQTQ